LRTYISSTISDNLLLEFQTTAHTLPKVLRSQSDPSCLSRQISQTSLSLPETPLLGLTVGRSSIIRSAPNLNYLLASFNVLLQHILAEQLISPFLRRLAQFDGALIPASQHTRDSVPAAIAPEERQSPFANAPPPPSSLRRITVTMHASAISNQSFPPPWDSSWACLK
jgi:hypothetical protein